MPIQLKVSNSLESLAKELAKELKANQSVFRPDYVVTQTQGMNNWLKNRLAEEMGIAANIRFITPNDVIHMAYRILGGKYEKSLSVHDLNWLLYELLDEEDFKNQYKRISSYYDTKSWDSEIKRMALAEKTADLFDQYQIYRFGMIESWNENQNYLHERFREDEDWQMELWFKAKEKAGLEFPDKTYVGRNILEALEDPEKTADLQKYLPEINFFGLSLITEYHLMLMDKLSEFIDIRFLIQNPSPNDYWYDDKSQKVLEFLKSKNKISPEIESDSNPLLVNWGRTVQNTFKMLFQKDEMLNVYEDVGILEPEGESLLHGIQTSVFNNEKDAIHFTEEQLNDSSVVINSCYSPVREVETLYNYLVHLIDEKNEKLSAKDIVVMVSDIDLYASYIKAIFDTGPYRFPYTIADESFQNTDNLFSALTEILLLNKGEFTSESVASLLDFSAVKNRFGIEDIEFVRQLISGANIRLGIKGNQEDESRYISWEYGLKRIMYGIAMSGNEEYSDGVDSFYPVDFMEGTSAFKAVSFMSFAQVLIRHMNKRGADRTVPEWVAFMWETVEEFIGSREDNDEEDYRELAEQLKRYNISENTFADKVSYEVFIHNFLPVLYNAKRSSAFGGRGITFCSLIPMRSIPFKVVALLGINYDNFPRQDNRVSFDLTKKETRMGDRNIKENDKHLFLENVLSAKDYLYISYIGQSVKDNTDIPASILVDELVDFIAKYSDNPDFVRENFIKKHPLHGFSRKYNAGDKELYSYMIESEKPELDFRKDTKDEQEFDFKEISINELYNFFKNPVKAYYNKVLNIYYEDEDLSLPEEEIFGLNHLEAWSYKGKLLDLDKGEIKQLTEKDKKLGKLPLKNMGAVVLDKVYKEVEPINEVFLEITAGMEPKEQEINLETDGSKIVGKIHNIFGNTLVEVSFSSSDAKNLFKAYLNYLLLNASEKPTHLEYIGKTGDVLSVPEYMDKNEAENRLNELVKIYKKGRREVYHLSMDLADKLKKGKSLSSLDKFDAATMKSGIAKVMENDFSHFYDVYLPKEYEKGALDDAESIYRKFREIYEKAIEPMVKLFKI